MDKMQKFIVEKLEVEAEAGSTLQEISRLCKVDAADEIIAAYVGGTLSELTGIPVEGSVINWIYTKDMTGSRIYYRSAVMLMLKAFENVCGKGFCKHIVLQYSMDQGVYCEVFGAPKPDAAVLEKVNEEMHRLSEQALPILKKTVRINEAVEIYRDEALYAKAASYDFKRSARVHIYELDGYMDYFYGYMAPDTSYVRSFKLCLYDEGFVLQLPNRKTPDQTKDFEPSEKLFGVLKEGTRWGELLGVSNVADLNRAIADGRFNELVLIQEALQEKKIADIAEMIKKDNKKIVLIAGPSSSGKTSFSHRLSIQLKAQGLRPHPIPVDMYFVNRDVTPRDENGKLDYECIGALDLKRFNDDIQGLLAGENVEIPVYNFITGKREEKGNMLQIGQGDVLVIEGIHALNDEMTYSVPKDDKFKIYISSLTILNMDEHNRISTTDARLLRRMCRDAVTRGASAAKTIGMWDSVRRGEDNNIFPYQESCDVMFNSALIYEISVLKQYAEPLLFSVRPDEPEYEEANRYLKMLDYFLCVNTDQLPHNSIIREFVGGSCFDVG